MDSEQILNLQEEIKFLENQIKDHHSSIDLLENNLQLTIYENEQLKHNYLEIQEKYDLLIKDNQLNNIRRSSIEEVCLISYSILPHTHLSISFSHQYIPSHLFNHQISMKSINYKQIFHF